MHLPYLFFLPMSLITLAGGTGVGASKNHLGDVFFELILFSSDSLVYECMGVLGGMGEGKTLPKEKKTDLR
ncbi:hypothetical protein V8C44DRAFT_180735 [Trichoderma aethiopicum]